jgi:hypothetical protein
LVIYVFDGGSAAAFNGYIPLVDAYENKNFVKAIYYGHAIIGLYPNFHLNDKVYLYLAKCYKIFGMDEITGTFVDSSSAIRNRNNFDELPDSWGAFFQADTAGKFLTDYTSFCEPHPLGSILFKANSNFRQFLSFFGNK